MSNGKDPSVRDTVGEIKEMLVAYAKQETIDPLKGLGRYIGFGLGGALLLGLGLFLIGLGILRALQTETTALTGNWSWVPYGVVFVLLVVLAGLFASRIPDKEDK